MLPTYKERLGSVIRALSAVVEPALPRHEALALEQLQLAIQHLHVIHDQFDGQRAVIDEEFHDALRLAEGLLSAQGDQVLTPNARELMKIVENREESEVMRRLIPVACAVIDDAYDRGSLEYQTRIRRIVANHELNSSNMERKIFKAFDFDNIN